MRSEISSDGAPFDAVVLGGGIIGLTCAWSMVLRGLDVALVDPGEPTTRSTWAAGGMLAPLGEASGPGAFLDFALASLRRYPAFAQSVQTASRRTVDLHLDGKLVTGSGPEEVAELAARYEWLRGEGHAVRWLNAEGCLQMEPALGPSVDAGLLLEGNGRVDPRALAEALESALETLSCRRVRERADGILVAGGRVAGVALAGGGELRSPAVVLACGAWSGELHGIPRELGIRPVKGQMLAYDAPDRPLKRVVISSRAYLIPRETPHGPRIVVGATSEEVGFDLALTDSGQEGLEAGSRELLPSLAGARVVERWAGLRPGTPDGEPILGPEPELPGLVYATGHYRNGVLLAPETGERVADAVEGRDPEFPREFSPARMGRTGLVTSASTRWS